MNIEGTKDLDAPAFTNPVETVISYKGENYYRACGVLVTQSPGNGTTSCVKRQDHPGTIHEDFDGKTVDDAAQRKRIFDWTTATPIETAVGEAVGLASACWEKLENAGVFDSTRASQIVDELVEYFQSKGPIY